MWGLSSPSSPTIHATFSYLLLRWTTCAFGVSYHVALRVSTPPFSSGLGGGNGGVYDLPINIDIFIVCIMLSFHGQTIHRIWPPVTLLTSKFGKMARRTAVHVEREGHRPNRCLLHGPSEILLFGRLKKVKKRLEMCIELKWEYYLLIMFTQVYHLPYSPNNSRK